MLIDCSPDLHSQARKAGLWRCDAILFTHNHVDHIFGLDEVRRFNAVMRGPIEVYAERYVMEALRRVYKHIFEAAANVNDSFVATLIARELPDPESVAARPIDLWGMRFTPVRLLHGRLPILGFVIEPMKGAGESTASGSPFPLAYCTDVSAVPTESWQRLTGLRTLVLDALRHRHHPTHLTLDQAVHVAERVGADRTYFIHMAHELGHAQTEGDLPDGIRLAYDGLVLGEPVPEGKRWRPAKPGGAKAAATGRFEEG